MRKFKTKNDLPGHKAGTIYYRSGGGLDHVGHENHAENAMNSISCEIIDANPDFFEEIKEEQKSAEEVTKDIIDRFFRPANSVLNDAAKNIIQTLNDNNLQIVKVEEPTEEDIEELAILFFNHYANLDKSKWDLQSEKIQTNHLTLAAYIYNNFIRKQ